MTLLEMSMFPIDKGVSLSSHVARIIDIIDQSGLPYRTGSMGTVIEGNLSELLELVKKCHSELENDCERIITNIKIDSKPGLAGTMRSKITSIEKKLGRKLST